MNNPGSPWRWTGPAAWPLTNDAIDGVRFGADYWVNYLAQTNDWLSVIGYNQGQQVLLPLTLLSPAADLGPTTTAIANLGASGQTNIGGALAEGVNQITSLGDQAATQVLILFSDGLHNTGTSPESVLGDLVEAGIRVYTIGFGPGADQVRLQQLASGTGGEFEQIDPFGSSPQAQLDIQNALIEISGEVRDGSGIVTVVPGLLPEPPAGEPPAAKAAVTLGHDRASLKRVAGIGLDFRCSWPGFDHRAYIEAGSARATFVVSHVTETQVRFFVQRPDGSVVNPSDDDVSFVDPPGSPYSFYVVDNPDPGFWVLRVLRAQARGSIPFTVFAFSEHKALAVAVDGLRPVARVGDRVRIRAQASYGAPLTGLRDPVLRLFPLSPASSPVTSVRLRERPVDPKADPAQKGLERVHNGIYEATVELPEPGSYRAEVLFVNDGGATEALGDAEPAVKGDRHDEVPVPPLFTRTKRFQIHVGPLPAGVDLDSDDGRDCEEAKRCLKLLLDRLPC